MIAATTKSRDVVPPLEPGDDVIIVVGSGARTVKRGVYVRKAARKGYGVVAVDGKIVSVCNRRIVFYPSPEVIAARAAVVRMSRYDAELREALGLPRIRWDVSGATRDAERVDDDFYDDWEGE